MEKDKFFCYFRKTQSMPCPYTKWSVCILRNLVVCLCKRNIRRKERVKRGKYSCTKGNPIYNICIFKKEKICVYVGSCNRDKCVFVSVLLIMLGQTQKGKVFQAELFLSLGAFQSDVFGRRPIPFYFIYE